MKSEIEKFKKIHGYPLNLDNPKTFNEKICHKKLFDRNPLIILTADKYRARDYIREKIGWESENYLVPLLYVTDKPGDIPFDGLPDEYIIKPNNAAGRWIITTSIKGLTKYEINHTRQERLNLSKTQIIGCCKDWFKTVFGKEANEWVYSQIKPLIVVEKLLHGKGKSLPSDYRFAMFEGKCRMIYVTTPRQETFNYYDQHWKPIPIERKGHPRGPVVQKPKQFEKMIRFAEILAEPFDFVRIDYFLTENNFYFSEITHYPAAGYGKLPKEYDLKLGNYWRLNGSTE